jgi:hypothetical protein
MFVNFVQGMSIDSEIAAYLHERMSPIASSPLTWWAVNDNRYPRIATLARKFLCIPASSASVERMFSVAGMYAAVTF